MNKNKILRYLLLLFFCLLPILDILRGTFVKDIEIFGIAIIELVNFILIGFSFIITIFKIDKKKLIGLLIYLVILGVYILLHYNNLLHFDTNIYFKSSFNFIIESYYIIRVYCLPVILIFVLYQNRDVYDKKFYATVITWLIAFISFSIIILNALKLSYMSYGVNSDGFIKYSFLDFYKYDGNHLYLLSRGWFDSANEISAVLCTLLPLNIYFLYKSNKLSNALLLFGQIFAMILLGTRTSAYGSLLISTFSLIGCIFMILLKKDKLKFNFILKFTAIIIICGSFFVVSPFKKSRDNYSTDRLQTNNSSLVESIENSTEERDKLIVDLEQNLYSFGLNPELVSLYPLEYDVEFWLEICKRDLVINNDNRILKKDIIARLKERNNSFSDTLFGIGYTLNFMDIERDYVYQYYLFGVIGLIILIGVFIIYYIKSVWLFIKDFKNKFKFEYILLFMPSMLCFVIAYFSGHVFGWISPIMILSLTLAYLRFNMMGDEDGES